MAAPSHEFASIVDFDNITSAATTEHVVVRAALPKRGKSSCAMVFFDEKTATFTTPVLKTFLPDRDVTRRDELKEAREKAAADGKTIVKVKLLAEAAAPAGSDKLREFGEGALALLERTLESMTFENGKPIKSQLQNEKRVVPVRIKEDDGNLNSIATSLIIEHSKFKSKETSFFRVAKSSVISGKGGKRTMQMVVEPTPYAFEDTPLADNSRVPVIIMGTISQLALSGLGTSLGATASKVYFWDAIEETSKADEMPSGISVSIADDSVIAAAAAAGAAAAEPVAGEKRKRESGFEDMASGGPAPAIDMAALGLGGDAY